MTPHINRRLRFRIGWVLVTFFVDCSAKANSNRVQETADNENNKDVRWVSFVVLY